LIAIVAIQCNSRLASGSGIAALGAVAGIAVIAIQAHPGQTSHRPVAALYPVTDVTVIADQCRATYALSIAALILRCTNILVSTLHLVILILTPGFVVTGIVGARVAIIAVHRWARFANAGDASVLDGTGIIGIARHTFVGRDTGAPPIGRVTNSL